MPCSPARGVPAGPQPNHRQRAILRRASRRSDGLIISTDRALIDLVEHGWARDPVYGAGGQGQATITPAGRLAAGGAR